MEDTKVEGFKRCIKCGRILPITEFSKDKSRKDGLNHYCKQCDRAKRKKYHITHRDSELNRVAAYYQANKEKNAAYNVEYYDPQKNPIGWAKRMVGQYRWMDRERGFDDSQTITAEWFLQNIAYKPCAHCGLLQAGAIGVNRLKNTEGHIPSNCEPCCFKCNARENIRDQLERGIHTSQLRKKQSFKEFVNEHKAKDKNLT